MREGKSVLVNVRALRWGDLMTGERNTRNHLSERVYPGSGLMAGLEAMQSGQGSPVTQIPSEGEGFHIS